MKFRPTIPKIIVSILSGIVMLFVMSESGIFNKQGSCLPDASGQVICVDYAASPLPIYIGIGTIIFVYIIWSLLSNKDFT